MLKLLGSACILAGSVLAQCARLAERRRQWNTLSDMLSALRQMGEEIRLHRTPMPLLLEFLAKDRCPDAADFFNQTAEELRRGENLAKRIIVLAFAAGGYPGFGDAGYGSGRR